MLRVCLVPGLLGCLLSEGASAGTFDLRSRWIYYSTNLLVDQNINELEAVFRRASNAGYNGVLLDDSKFGRLDEMGQHYFQNVARVKAIAARDKLELIPAVFPIGYSEGLLAHDPNLAEGLPVKDALFVVRNGVAQQTADPPVELRGADFHDLTQWNFHDADIFPDNGAVRVTDPEGHNARIMQRVGVHQFRQYHISVEVKTEGFSGTPEVKVLTKTGQSLNYADLGARSTQDWTAHDVVFNSLDNNEVAIYLGCWDGQGGSLWWRHPRIEETALVNLLRRDGAPLEVRTEDGKLLAEGRDFQKVADPRMGTVPWPGSYEVWHQPPIIHTSVPDGTRLRVSYYHTVTFNDGQVTICPSEPETVALLRDQARRMHAAWDAHGYFMSHDEICLMNWDQSCEKRGLDAGAILADNIRTCIGILREINPGGDIYVWSDMFDPNHNAHANYYLVHGNLSGSWRGLDKDVIIVPWNFDKRLESIKWFAGLGNRMLIAGYYDGHPERIQQWLDAAKEANADVVGVMYTTWKHQYGDLETFERDATSY